MDYLLKSLTLIPYIVAGVEQIHVGAAGTDKKTIAMQALNLATAGAAFIAPNEASKINAASTAISGYIDNTVALFNATGLFKK